MLSKEIQAGIISTSFLKILKVMNTHIPFSSKKVTRRYKFMGKTVLLDISLNALSALQSNVWKREERVTNKNYEAKKVTLKVYSQVCVLNFCTLDS